MVGRSGKLAVCIFLEIQRKQAATGMVFVEMGKGHAHVMTTSKLVCRTLYVPPPPKEGAQK